MQLSSVEQFLSTGYIVIRNLCPPGEVAELKLLAIKEFNERLEPIELEADVGYPGAPNSRAEPGGRTIRRLLNAVDRSPRFESWMCGSAVGDSIEALIGEAAIMSRVHHNCIMTKHPKHGSRTDWHRDIRYWSFARPELVSAWLALSHERPENGSLMLAPGSHSLEIDDSRFDSLKFLRPDIAENARLLGSAVQISLNPGDVLFFHCRTLHAAGQNTSEAIKWSLVSTYHGVSNQPIDGTRSAALSGVPIRRAG